VCPKPRDSVEDGYVPTFLIEPILESRGKICRDILNELPDWFGIPESVEEYASFAEDADMLGATSDGFVAGFITLRSTSDVAAEIYVMAIRPSFHRMGLGSALVNAASEKAGASGHRYLTVKTVGPSRPNLAYEATRRFYQASGFEPIEEFEDLWDENPCLLMLKPI
jgi:ribosomal protein S18 acetylase RimI-like enzyme